MQVFLFNPSITLPSLLQAGEPTYLRSITRGWCEVLRSVWRKTCGNPLNGVFWSTCQLCQGMYIPRWVRKPHLPPWGCGRGKMRFLLKLNLKMKWREIACSRDVSHPHQPRGCGLGENEIFVEIESMHEIKWKYMCSRGVMGMLGVNWDWRCLFMCVCHGSFITISINYKKITSMLQCFISLYDPLLN